MTSSKQKLVGVYNEQFNSILGINIKQRKIYCSDGLKMHLIKRNHINCLKYLGNVSDIIKSPDYIGINPNEKGESIELVKRYAENVLIGLKVDTFSDIIYVSTMFDLQESKLQRRIHSGRLKPYKE